MAGRRSGHPHETACRCGELRIAAGEADVEQGGEVVKRLRRRAVRAQGDVVLRGYVREPRRDAADRLTASSDDRQIGDLDCIAPGRGPNLAPFANVGRATVADCGNSRMARPPAGRSVRAMFRTIVIGYDGPERGGEAAILAEVLRDPRKGSLLLTSAYPPAPLTVGGFVMPETLEELRDATEELLVEARDALPATDRARIRAVPCDSAARALTEVAEAEHADLVVVGSSHRGALGRVLPGTTAERLLHGAPCAVAVAPRGYRGANVRHLGVAYDGSPEAGAALHTAEALALELRAAITVYCVVEPARMYGSMISPGTGAVRSLQAAEEHARHLLHAAADNAPDGLRAETLLLHGAAAEQIAGRGQGVIDLLFMGSRGYGPIRHALLGSVSGALVRDAGCPVVVTPRTALAPRHAPKAVAAAGA
jgi:nucleotide-binding universal stress UspA family protein